MSDFLFSSAPRPPGELERLLERFLSAVTAKVTEVHGDWGSLAVAACPHDVTPLISDAGGHSVLLGWPVLHDPARFRSAPVLDSARRLAVHRMLLERQGVEVAAALDGPFATLAIDPARGEVAALSDRMGFIPLYSARVERDTRRGLVLGSHVDAVALAAGQAGEVDPVSAADFLVHSTITYPRTLYPGVEQFPPATERRWREPAAPPAERCYWLPLEQPPTRYLGRAARVLRGAFAQAVADGCAGLDRVGLLLSGGEDSRAVLGAIPRGVSVDAFIYGDWENREYRIARRVASLYGARLHFGRREPDHYLGFPTVGPVLGTQHRYTDVHGFGLHRELRLGELPLVLGGYLSDSLLKANYAQAPKRKMLRRVASRPGERGRVVIPRADGVRDELLREVEVRRALHRERIREMRPFSASEWLVLWPFTMRATGANLHGGRRLFRDFEPFLSNGVLEVAAAVPQWWKRERLLFHRAMRPFLAPSWHVPHGRSRYPFFGPIANVPLGLAVKGARAVRDRIHGEAGRRQGPWPSLGALVSGPEMARCRDLLPTVGTRLDPIFEPALDPPGRCHAQRSWNPEQQLGFLQMVHLLREIGA